LIENHIPNTDVGVSPPTIDVVNKPAAARNNVKCAFCTCDMKGANPINTVRLFRSLRAVLLSSIVPEILHTHSLRIWPAVNIETNDARMVVQVM